MLIFGNFFVTVSENSVHEHFFNCVDMGQFRGTVLIKTMLSGYFKAEPMKKSINFSLSRKS